MRITVLVENQPIEGIQAAHGLSLYVELPGRRLLFDVGPDETLFANADAFFGRTVEEYRSWLLGNTREQLDFVLLDLIQLSRNQLVICDCHLTLEQVSLFTDPARVVFLLKEPSNIIEDYCNRPDHQGFNSFINSASDPVKAKATCNETLRSLNEDFYRAVKHSEYFWVERTPDSNVQRTVEMVERHFGLLR